MTTQTRAPTTESSRLPLWLGIAAALAWPVVGLVMGAQRLWVDAETGEEVVNLGAVGVLLAVLLSLAGLALAVRQRRRGERTRAAGAALWLNAVVLGWWLLVAGLDLLLALVVGE